MLEAQKKPQGVVIPIPFNRYAPHCKPAQVPKGAQSGYLSSMRPLTSCDANKKVPSNRPIPSYQNMEPIIIPEIPISLEYSPMEGTSDDLL